jgi:hypothetical protein
MRENSRKKNAATLPNKDSDPPKTRFKVQVNNMCSPPSSQITLRKNVENTTKVFREENNTNICNKHDLCLVGSLWISSSRPWTKKLQRHLTLNVVFTGV